MSWGSSGARLTELAVQHTQPPARLMKTIGDAVMFVAPAPEPLLDTMLDLVARRSEEEEDFPRLRAGVAAGLAVSREGDWYGPPVNLASRVTGVARPGSVLATHEVHDAAPDGYAWSPAGGWELKGFKRRVPLSACAARRGSLQAPSGQRASASRRRRITWTSALRISQTAFRAAPLAIS